MLAATSTIWAIRSSSESNGDVSIRALIWPHRKKSIGVKSGNLGGQAIGRPHPIQQPLLSAGEMLILKRILFPLSLRQQQPTGSNLAFLPAHVSLCCVTVGCVLRLVAVHLNVCSKWYKIQLFSEYFSGFSRFSTLVRPNLTVCSAVRTHLQHTVPGQ